VSAGPPVKGGTRRMRRPSRIFKRREIDFRLGSFAVQKRLLSSYQVNLCLLELSEREKAGESGTLPELLLDRELLTEHQIEALQLQLAEAGPSLESGDLLLGRLVLDKGLADPEAVRSCLEKQAKLAKEGINKRLGELLVEEGQLSSSTVENLLRRHLQHVLKCGKCGVFFGVRGYNPEKTYRCKRCDGALTEGSQISPALDSTTLYPSDEVTEPYELREGLASSDYIPGMTSSNFAGYEIQERLAEGTMGYVFKATRDGEVFALKVLKEARDEQQMARVTRFKGEAKACKRIDNRYVVRIYDEGVYEDHHWFAMDYIEGSSLKTYMDGSKMRLDEGISAVIKIAEGLAAAHEAGVIHRDLKPANIMIALAGDPVITDFGLARDLIDDPKITRAGFAVGTPNYMAPEQVRGESELISPCTDIYALGVILYQALTGEVPFKANTTPELFIRIDEGNPTPPSAKNPNVTRKLERICLTALQRNPKKRYQNATDFATALQSVLPAGKLRMPGYRERKRSRRRKQRFMELITDGCQGLQEGRHQEALALFRKAAAETEEHALLIKNVANYLTTPNDDYVAGAATVLLQLPELNGHRPLMERLLQGDDRLERMLVKLGGSHVLSFLSQASRSHSQMLRETAVRLKRRIYLDQEQFLRIWLLPDKGEEQQRSDLIYFFSSTKNRGKDPAEELTLILDKIDQIHCDRISVVLSHQSDHLLGLAREHLTRGEVEQALHQLELCLLFGPVNQLALLTRADLYEAVGETKQALGDFKRVLKLSPKNEALQRHIEALEKEEAKNG